MSDKDSDKKCAFFFEDEIKLYCSTHKHYFILADSARRRNNLQLLIEQRVLTPEALFIATRELSTPA